ncbi:MAG TPA: hypothetical protein VFL29_00445 [Candidatus Dormibacteraeota bacterium]|nr:hypothetical protein [Candidatus Dormibacteraeota bacterium]
MRNASRYAGVAVAVLLLAACDSLCGGGSTATAAKQNLVFTGPVAGTLTDAHVDCRVNGGTQFNAAITGTFNAKPLVFNVQIHSAYNGAGTYPVGSLLDGAGELRLQVGDFLASTTTGAGTLTIDQGGKSGSMDAALSNGEHVKGSFKCDQLTTG